MVRKADVIPVILLRCLLPDRKVCMICRHIISEMSFLWMFNAYVIQIDHVVL